MRNGVTTQANVDGNDNDHDDGGDYNSTNDRKELKFRLKTHTRHEIATTIIKHARIHYSMPLPNVYIWKRCLSSSVRSIACIDEQKIRFFSCILCCISQEYIHTHNELFSCCWFLSSTMLSMVGWFLMDSFICCFASFFFTHSPYIFSLIHEIYVFGVFFSCRFCLFSNQTCLLHDEKSRKSQIAIRFSVHGAHSNQYSDENICPDSMVLWLDDVFLFHFQFNLIIYWKYSLSLSLSLRLIIWILFTVRCRLPSLGSCYYFWIG